MICSRFSEHFTNVDQVFRPAERSRLVYEILLRCPYRSPAPPRTGKFTRMSFIFESIGEPIDNYSRQYACSII